MLLKAAFGMLLIALAATAHLTFTDRADDRVANGDVATSRVAAVQTARAPNSLTVQYEYHGSPYQATARSLFGDASNHVAGTEIVVYVDPSDPRSIALPGGFASDGGWWLVILPVPLAVNGGVFVLLAVARAVSGRAGGPGPARPPRTRATLGPAGTRPSIRERGQAPSSGPSSCPVLWVCGCGRKRDDSGMTAKWKRRR